jgi:hypothetical protein
LLKEKQTDIIDAIQCTDPSLLPTVYELTYKYFPSLMNIITILMKHDKELNVRLCAAYLVTSPETSDLQRPPHKIGCCRNQGLHAATMKLVSSWMGL